MSKFRHFSTVSASHFLHHFYFIFFFFYKSCIESDSFHFLFLFLTFYFIFNTSSTCLHFQFFSSLHIHVMRTVAIDIYII